MAESGGKNLGNSFSDYSVESMMYPYDLQDAPEYSSNKVVFFINVAAGSSMSSADSKTYGDTATGGNVDLFDIPDGDVSKTSGKSLEAATNSGVDLVNKAGVMAPLMLAKLKRLSKAIALHMPLSIVQRTSVNWSEKDLMEDSALAVVGADVLSKVSSGDLSGAIGTGVGGAAAKAMRGKSLAQRATRITPGNSGQEILFEGIDYRSIGFSYSFTPRNKKEADNIMNIIRTFKYHMLPEFKSSSEYLYIYPSEFQIKYYTGNEENQYIEKQLTAVLTSVNIDYTPLGQFATFKDGMPQKINMSLEFKEIGTPTKETASYGTRRGI